MAKKRPPISFPEFEPKGVRAILRSAEEIRAEQALLAAREQHKHQAPVPPPRPVAGHQQPQFDLNHKTEKYAQAQNPHGLRPQDQQD
jgi:hypothetical protein